MPALYSTVVQLVVAHVMYDGWVLPGLPVHLVKSVSAVNVAPYPTLVRLASVAGSWSLLRPVRPKTV